MPPYIAELLGTMMLIILGGGVVANVTLNKSGTEGADSIQVIFAWGLAVMLPAFIFGAASGAYFNPVLTITLAVDESMAQGLVPGYIVTQLTGAFMGAVIVYLLFKDQYDITESAATRLRTFCTGPSVPNMEHSILNEAVDMFVLIFAIEGVSWVTGIVPDVDKLLVFGIIISIGVPLGSLTDYTISPARDLGPRLAYAVLSIKGKDDSNWGYTPAIIIGPIMGAAAAVLLYQTTPWM